MTGEELADEMELDRMLPEGITRGYGRGNELAKLLLGEETRVFCCHPVRAPRRFGDWLVFSQWNRYSLLPKLHQADVEARSFAAATAVLVSWRLGYFGREVPVELAAMAARVLAEGGAIWVGVP